MNNNIENLVSKYEITDDELKQITDVAELYANIQYDKETNLLKWTSEFDAAMIKSIYKLRPEIDEDVMRRGFKSRIKNVSTTFTIDNIDELLFTVFKLGVEYGELMRNDGKG